MGLDIGAHKNINKIDAVYDSCGDPICPVTREGVDYSFIAYVNPSFPGRADGIEDEAVYKSDEVSKFSAGSYSGYGWWRNQLAKMVGCPEQEYDNGPHDKIKTHCLTYWNGGQGPFAELINFSDCEGTIGPKTSAKLAQDFADYQQEADASEYLSFRMMYREFRQAFEMASNNGAVVFD